MSYSLPPYFPYLSVQKSFPGNEPAPTPSPMVLRVPMPSETWNQLQLTTYDFMLLLRVDGGQLEASPPALVLCLVPGVVVIFVPPIAGPVCRSLVLGAAGLPWVLNDGSCLTQHPGRGSRNGTFHFNIMWSVHWKPIYNSNRNAELAAYYVISHKLVLSSA